MHRSNNIFSRICATALVVAFSFSIPVAAQTNLIEKQPKVKVDNFGQIGDRYFRGAQPEGQDYADLAALGIKTVINLTSDDAEENERQMVEGSSMKYLQIPMTTHEPPTAAKIEEFLKIVNDPASQPVYVHCVGGRHRTGVMTAIYRMKQEGWTAEQAFKEMKQYKYGPDFLHSEFKKFVFDYYTQLVQTAQLKAKEAVVEVGN